MYGENSVCTDIEIYGRTAPSPIFLSYFSGVGLSSPFLKILPYEVARGWVEGLNGHKVSVEGAANMSNFFNILRNERICMLGRA